MFDVFISHATEDKKSVARPFAHGLKAAGLQVWYDEFSLRLGDSLRTSIDRGLAESRHGVVILSPSFFNKSWPQIELNGLFAKEISAGKSLLPVWHELEARDLLKVSPIMADRVAAKTADGLDKVIEKILEVVEPDSFHLTSKGLTSQRRITLDHDIAVFRKLDAIANEPHLGDILNAKIPNSRLLMKDHYVLADLIEALSRIENRFLDSKLKSMAKQLKRELEQLLDWVIQTFSKTENGFLRFYPDAVFRDYYDAHWKELTQRIDKAWIAYKDFRLAVKENLMV